MQLIGLSSLQELMIMHASQLLQSTEANKIAKIVCFQVKYLL